MTTTIVTKTRRTFYRTINSVGCDMNHRTLEMAKAHIANDCGATDPDSEYYEYWSKARAKMRIVKLVRSDTTTAIDFVHSELEAVTTGDA